MKQVALVLGTFLPFHKGHEALIRFASSYVGDLKGRVLVILSSRQQEPIAGELRFHAIRNTFHWWDSNIHVYHHTDSNAPQSPKGDDDVEFWNYWKGVVEHACKMYQIEPPTHVVSSEAYGAKMAQVIGAKHVVFDDSRRVVDIAGTRIRDRPLDNHQYMNTEMAKLLRKKFVLFGAESVGKSTMLRALSRCFDDSMLYTHEWARPYLESQEDVTPTVENMTEIFKGQYAMEQAFSKSNSTHLAMIMDTDIMSTFGYAKMTGMHIGQFQHMWPLDDRLYFVLGQDDVPFEHDRLRYGGDKRESTDEFWLNLLKSNGKRHHYVTGSKGQRLAQIVRIISEEVGRQFYFQREV